jgi:TonB-linked SusC/RagA family outer membrane protein
MKLTFYRIFYGSVTFGLLGCLAGAPTHAQVLAAHVASSPAPGQEGSNRTSLLDALEDIKARHGISLLFERKNVEGVTVDRSRYAGAGSPEQALQKLLQGTELRYQKIAAEVYVVLGRKEKYNQAPGRKDRRTSAAPVPDADGAVPTGPAAPAAATAPQEQPGVAAIAVSGTVKADNGEPLPGVSVVVKGTQNGTVTDAAGSYRISVPDGNAVLVFSFIGYTTEEVTVGTRTTVDVLLVGDIKALSEVVVVGYGTQVRRDVTGAIATVKGEDIARVPVASFDAALQGRAAGVQVSQAGGVPGGPVRIQIRGTSSVSSGTEPLYIVDGMPIFQDIGNNLASGRTNNTLNPLVNINPADIESIEVLKDAAATAIYGSRGANGVVIITTKTGKRGQARTTVDYNQGVSEATRLIDYVSGPQWLEMVDQARANSVGFGITAGQEVFDPQILVSNTLPTPAGIGGTQFGPYTGWTRSAAENTDTDWRDYMLRRGSLKELNLSTSNGFEKGAFFLSGQYRDEEGILTGSRLQRYSARANLDFQPTDKIRAGAKFSFSYLNANQAQVGIGNNGAGIGRQNFGATGGWGQVNAGALPIMPVYNDDGTYFDPLRGRNVAAGLDPANVSSRTEQNRTLGSAFLEYTVFKGLTLHGEASADFINNNSIFWVSDVIRYSPAAAEEGRFINNRNFNAYATFARTFGRVHDLSVTAGAETQKRAFRRQDYAFEGLQSAQQEIGEIANGASQFITGVSGIFPDFLLVSNFARLNYKFRDRYLAGLSFRRDGSSSFGPNNRYGNFPAASLGWIISEEDFFGGLGSTFNLLKVRTSYGRTGNTNIPSFAFLNGYVNWPVYGVSPAYGFSVLANPDIGWERNDQFDAALEFGLLNNRVSGSVGYYDKLSRGMLLNVAVAPNVGIGPGSASILTNIGDLRNRGVELQLSTTNLDIRGFRWTSELNFTTNANKVQKLTPQFTQLPTGTSTVAPGIVQQGITNTQEGGRLGAFYLAEYAGLDGEGFETIYAVDVATLRSTGQTVRLKDASGADSTLRATSQNVTNNRFLLEKKTGLPTWYGGFTNTFSFKGIELNVLFTFQGGNYIYDALEENTSYVRSGGNVIRSEVYGNTWTEENPGAEYPKLTWNLRDNNLNPATGLPAPQALGTRTTRFLYKGDFARLKTLQIAYSLPPALVQRIRLQQVRVYANAQNLLTFTRYPGYDPETLLIGGNQDRNLAQGFINAAPVPQVRTFNFGMSVTF